MDPLSQLGAVSLSSATLWSERAIAIALLLQTLELLQLRHTLADDGIWRWPVLRREHVALPAVLRGVFALLLPYRAFLVLLWARLLAALALLCFGRSELLAGLWLSQVAICVRFRGTFNGGSDYMTVLILLGLSVARLAPAESLLARAGLAYIAVQLTLSYFIAGLAKLKEHAWRDGSALAEFLAASAYGAPAWAQPLAAPGLRRVAALGVLGFECLFPVAWLDPRLCLLLLAAGAVFHLANSFVFGLNRFLFAWLAAYPSLLYCSQLLAGS